MKTKILQIIFISILITTGGFACLFSPAVQGEMNPAKENSLPAWMLGLVGGNSGSRNPNTNTSSGSKDISTFSISGQAGTIGVDSIGVIVPFGTSAGNLTAIFTHTGASINIAGVEQISGVTKNDFTSSKEYTVVAADGTTKNYTVTVVIASNSAKDITAFSILGQTGTTGANSIGVTVPFGTSLTNLVATFTFTGASVNISGVNQVSGITTNDFTTAKIYTIVAADGTTKNYTITVAVAANPTKDITAFSILGQAGTISVNSIGVTVPFGTSITNLVSTFTSTGASVNISGVSQISGTTANDFTTPKTYTVVAADGTTQNYTVTVTVASNSAKDITAFSILGVAGTIGANSVGITVPYGTSVTNLVATFTTLGASVNISGVNQVSATTANNFTTAKTYTVVAADGTTKNYTVTVTVAANPAKDITAFSILGVSGTIGANSVGVTVPFGTSVTNLASTFTITGASVNISGVNQVSATTGNDFTTAKTYTVVAADGTTKNYTVTVAVAANPAKDITAFSILGVAGIIGANSIGVTAPFGTSVTSLVATFTITGASVNISGVNQVSATTANDFTSAKTYTVVAADGTTKNYTVTVTVAANPAKDITAFSILGVSGTIGANSVGVTVPYGTNPNGLVATFTITGASVNISGVNQVSATTANNFTSAKTYTVVAADGTTKAYTVTVAVAANPAKDITAFSILGVSGTIGANSVGLTVPFGTSVTNLVSTFTITGASVNISGVNQVSATTSNDFTTAKIYTVVAADGTTKAYTVTVTVNPAPGPTGLVAKFDDSLVSLSWSNLSGATSYNIYWNTTSPVTTSSNKITSASSPYLHSGLADGSTYYYAVTAMTAQGETLLSAEVSTTPSNNHRIYRTLEYIYPNFGSFKAGNKICSFDNYRPSSYSNYKALLYDSNPLKASTNYYRTDGVTFIATSDSAGVFQGSLTNSIAIGSDHVWFGSLGTTCNNWTDNTGSRWGVVVTGNQSPWTSIWPEIAQGSCDNDQRLFCVEQDFGSPTNLKFSSVDNAQISIAWNSVIDATSYNLYWNTSGNVSTSDNRIQGLTGTQYTHTGLTNGTTYYYTISAIRGGVETELTPYEISASSPVNGYRLFVSSTSSNGNLGGFSGANTVCNNDINRPSINRIYKAFLINDGSVLQANSAYYRTDGKTIVGTTNSSGIMPVTLSNSISNSNSNKPIWFGSGAAYYSCNSWTFTGSSLYWAYHGFSSSSTNWGGDLNGLGSRSCQNGEIYYFYCAEQP